ncbi:AraC family transcriptional regulator [Candidatus Methylospira mobilis]|uniref:AraC family transcriptional regulator n=1 Tax=Candidatus Methylospira mobilis TaxID=1808979 RepID=A0A5Q0BQ20_9GAMM|nr:AraC family transcriptional regulator [Candidatus Methylospira mobilis]QFY44178.1 AraC family transcriptional regulator [Candidatus Methylospira mobilis]WNV06400.1 AraC family transcriptional regulator [Candidatus Methylospira mobilis]
MNLETDRLLNWLVGNLDLETSVFHVGQYCGPWHASTSGRMQASFHIVLRGHCFLHMERCEPIALGSREAVFLLRDLPHSLTPDSAPGALFAPIPMQPMQPVHPDGASLACGFFSLRGLAGKLLAESFPDYLILRTDSDALRAIVPLFDLILAEADRDMKTPSPLIERLTELLFFYLVRDMTRRKDIVAGLWTVASRPQFAPLVDQLLRDPARSWSVEDMARMTHMSRASFFKHFVDSCGLPPAQFLLLLRMNIAARRLRNGETVTLAAERVGYQSPAAFTRAFTKIIGEPPGAYQRARRVKRMDGSMPVRYNQ